MLCGLTNDATSKKGFVRGFRKNSMAAGGLALSAPLLLMFCMKSKPRCVVSLRLKGRCHLPTYPVS